jgi:sulfite reductase beta subunit-like hemoprotein
LPSAGVSDRCPGVLRLHRAQDGQLARVRLPGGRIDPAGLDAIATVAEQTGGAIECSSRASLQLRGLNDADAAGCAEALAGAGLLPSATHERVRNIIASPLGGRHPSALIETDGLVGALDRQLCDDPALVALPGRFLFAIEDGSATLDIGRADVVLIADGELLRLRVGELETDLAAVPDRTPELLLDAARAFLALGTEAHGVRSLPGQGRELVQAMGAAVLATSHRPRSRLPPGVIGQRDRRCAVTATVPLARLAPDSVRGLAALAGKHATDIRVSTDRTVTLVDIEFAAATAVRAELDRLGLVTHESGWQGLTACAGRGACANALVDVRAGARARAARRRLEDPREHWSACPRRCGHPAGDAVSVTAHAEGELVVSGAESMLAPVRAAVAGLDAVRVVVGR